MSNTSGTIYKDIADAIHRALTDNPKSSVDSLPDWKRDVILDIARVVFSYSTIDVTPEVMRAAWVKVMRARGWSYGPVKNEIKKQHPCLTEDGNLSDVERQKDTIACRAYRKFATAHGF